MENKKRGRKPLAVINTHGIQSRASRARIYADPERYARWLETNRKRYRELKANPVWREKANCRAREQYRLKIQRYGRAAHAESARLRKYGLKPGAYAVLLSWQNNLCPVCEKPGPTYVDHDHATGVVRGVLHPRCNLIVGLVEGSVDYYARAKDYVNGLL